MLGLFLIVWATDTGALVFGKLIGGKKLWPAVSPGKTWAGTIGGSVTAVAVFALYIAFFSFNVAGGAVASRWGFSVVAHLGDLFESWVKRRFGTKDSGGLIPGHGGVLDRMDSTFACSVGAGASGVRAARQPACSGGMRESHRRHDKIWDELPAMDAVLARARHRAGLHRLHRRQHAGCHRPCAQAAWRRCPARSRR